MQRRIVYLMALWIALVTLSLTGCETAPEAELSRKVSPDWSRGIRLGMAYFGEPLALATEEARGWFHIVWTGETDGTQNLHYLRLGTRGEVLLERDLAMDVTKPRLPQLLLGQGGRLHLLFLAYPPGSKVISLFHTLLNEEGQIAIAPGRVSAPDQEVGYYRAALNAVGEMEVYWSVAEAVDSGIHHLRLNEDGTPVSSPVLLVAGGTAFDVQIGAGGEIHLTWFQPWPDGQGQEVRYASFAHDQVEPLTGVQLAEMPTPLGISVWGPTLGLDMSNVYVFWSRDYRVGLEAGMAETSYATFRLGAPAPGVRRLVLPAVGEPVYSRHDGPFGYANLAFLSPGQRYGSDFLSMPVPVAGQMSELPILITMKVVDPGRAKAQVVAVVFSQGEPRGYQFVAKTTLFSQYPLAVSDAAHGIHAVWSDLVGRGKHVVYFASTARDVRDRTDRLWPSDVANSSLEMVWGMLSGLVILPLVLLWVLPAAIWLAVYTFMGRGDDLVYRSARIALVVGILLYLGSKLLWMPTIMDYVPFSAWVPLPLRGVATPLRILTPLLILGMALLVGYARMRRSDSTSVFAFMVPFVLVDALLTIAVYGPSIVPQG